jgi:hypothetical protein
MVAARSGLGKPRRRLRVVIVADAGPALTENGYTDADDSVEVDVTDGTVFTATVETSVDTSFAIAIGAGPLLGTAVQATSRNGCTPGGCPSLPAMFSSGQCAPTRTRR